MLFYGFGTIAFSYSTTFYCHQPAAFCSFLSFVLVMHIRKGNFQKKGIVALLAGFSAASAVLIEPSALFILAAVSLYLVSFKEGRPLASSYNYANEMVMWKIDGRLFGIPTPVRLFRLLFSPYRGLLFSSPIFLMALPGVFFFLRDKRWRAEAILCATLSVFFIILIASFHAWHGGSAPGPRYLLPAFPFLFLLAGFPLKQFTVVGNEIPREIRNPLGEVVFKNVIAGSVSINPVPFSHFEHYNIDGLANIEAWKPNFNSFNLGEIIFPHSLASILPLICFWVIWGYWWKRLVRMKNHSEHKKY